MASLVVASESEVLEVARNVRVSHGEVRGDRRNRRRVRRDAGRLLHALVRGDEARHTLDDARELPAAAAPWTG